MRVLTEERDKGKGREGNYREEHVEREMMIASPNQSAASGGRAAELRMWVT
jgi:hypothetical protein